MENQQTKLDKAVKISTIIGILIISLSAVYYFVIGPLVKDNKDKNSYQACVKKFTNNCKNTGCQGVSASEFRTMVDLCVKQE